MQFLGDCTAPARWLLTSSWEINKVTLALLRRALAVYPMFLFYLVIGWMVWFNPITNIIDIVLNSVQLINTLPGLVCFILQVISHSADWARTVNGQPKYSHACLFVKYMIQTLKCHSLDQRRGRKDNKQSFCIYGHCSVSVNSSVTEHICKFNARKVGGTYISFLELFSKICILY